MRRIITTAAVFTALIGGALLPGTAAQAAGPNYLARDCGKYATSCVFAPATFDQLGRTLSFRDGTGATITARSAKAVQRVVTAHSVKCRTPNSVSCYSTDPVTKRRVLAFRDGLHVAFSFFH